MPTLLRFSQLSSPRQALIRLFQSVNFGQVLALTIQDGEPVFHPEPMVLMDVKLDADEGERPELELSDFTLRDEVRRLMQRLDEFKNGRIERIEVRHGIPWRLTVERSLAEAPR